VSTAVPDQTVGVSRWWEAGLDLVVVLAIVLQSARNPAAWTLQAWLICAVALVAVFARRRATLTSALAGAALSAAAAVYAPSIASLVWILAQVCLFSVPLRRSRRQTLLAGATLAAVLFADALLRMGVTAVDPVSLALVGWTAAVAGAGLTLRAQRDYLEAVRAQARAADAARDSAIARRVSDERLRIARDLHDAVAHNIAVISLHAGAADQALPARPAEARQALREVRAASRTVLSEMQSILAVLRGGESTADESVVTAAAVPDLVQQFRQAGFDIVCDAGLNLDDLEPAADVAAYRLLQEALTNAHRHGAGPIRISAARDGGMLRLTVSNAVRPTSGAGRSGYGLIGMRERVVSAGGELDARFHGERFVLSARLPLRVHEEAE
jgi:signal transduction histidine kinase